MFGIIVTVLALVIAALLLHFALVGRKVWIRQNAQAAVLANPYGLATRKARHVRRAGRHARATRILAAHRA